MLHLYGFHYTCRFIMYKNVYIIYQEVVIIIPPLSTVNMILLHLPPDWTRGDSCAGLFGNIQNKNIRQNVKDYP